MKKLLTLLVLFGLLLSLQVSFVGAQESEPTDTPPPTTYLVQEGDTAESIAATFGVSVEDLLAANGLTSAEEIVAGMTLVIPPVPEPTEAATEEPVPTEEATQEPVPTEEATQEPVPTEEATQEPVPTEEATQEPTEAATEAPTPELTQEPPAAATTAGKEVEAAGALPGTATTRIIAIANLETSGSPEAPVLTLYDIDDADQIVVGGMPSVYPGGVGFVTDSQFATGRYAGVIQSSFQAAAAALTVNATAKTADVYRGLDANLIAQTLYGPIIYNKHVGWESILYCQNAGSGPATITAALYQRGVASPVYTFTANNVPANESVTWDIADDPAAQAAWPGGTGKYGYVRFNSPTNNIACVVNSQNLNSPRVEASYAAVPASFADTTLNLPLVYNGHGASSSSDRASKINSGFAIVNTSGSPVQATVSYVASNGYSVNCTQTVAGNSSINWYTPQVWTNGMGGVWTCDKPFPLTYVLDQTSFGSAKLTAIGGTLLGITNHAQFDTKAGKGQAFTSLGVPSSKATNRVVCPLAFNKNASSDWVTGVRVANVASSGSTIVTWRMVRAGVDPNGAGNFATIQKTIDAGAGKSAYFPLESSALKNFEGAVFVQAANPTDQILATSVNSNFGSLDAVAMYDCINY